MGLLVEVSIPKTPDQRADYDAIVDSELAELAMRREYDAVIDEENDAEARERDYLLTTLREVRRLLAQFEATPRLIKTVIDMIDGVLAGE